MRPTGVVRTTTIDQEYPAIIPPESLIYLRAVFHNLPQDIRMTLWQTIRKALSILWWRITEQGIKTTLIWFYVRVVPWLTGIPILKYSRITPQVYVGTQFGPAGKRLLERHGINGGVNMRIEYDDDANGVALEHYCHLPVVDDEAPSMGQLEEGIAFIDRVLAAGGKAYIHCAAGVGRAPTMGVAYFIAKGDTLDEAVARVQTARPFIKIMPPQWGVLRQFEAEVRRGM